MLTLSLSPELERQLVELAKQRGQSAELLAAGVLSDYLIHRPAAQGETASPYVRFKARLLARYPALAGVSQAEARRRMEELSAKIRESMPFATLEEAQAFMRGTDRYDFERQQYLHY